MKIPTITPERLAALVRDSRLIQRGPLGDKVRLATDGRIIKFFYLKRTVSSARLVPYVRRFCRNAGRLQALGIATVHCEECWYDPLRRRYLALYRPLPGKPMRELLQDRQDTAVLLAGMARFCALLHAKGVYFRALHFGNVLIDDDRPPALIDITDLKIHARGLGPWYRARNFRHLLHDPADRAALERFGLQRFRETYEQAAAFEPATRRRFRRWLRRTAPAFIAW